MLSLNDSKINFKLRVHLYVSYRYGYSIETGELFHMVYSVSWKNRNLKLLWKNCEFADVKSANSCTSVYIPNRNFLFTFLNFKMNNLLCVKYRNTASQNKLLFVSSGSNVPKVRVNETFEKSYFIYGTIENIFTRMLDLHFKWSKVMFLIVNKEWSLSISAYRVSFTSRN